LTAVTFPQVINKEILTKTVATESGNSLAVKVKLAVCRAQQPTARIILSKKQYIIKVIFSLEVSMKVKQLKNINIHV
jgi:hypothetical protein